MTIMKSNSIVPTLATIGSSETKYAPMKLHKVAVLARLHRLGVSLSRDGT